MYEIKAKIISGTGYASGKNPRFSEEGTIALQKPFFEEKIEDIDEIYNGTLNLDISPRLFEIVDPDYKITCKWHPDYEEETFLFVKANLFYKEKEIPCYIYYPAPSKLKAHKTNNVLEILCSYIENIDKNLEVILKVSKKKIKII